MPNLMRTKHRGSREGMSRFYVVSIHADDLIRLGRHERYHVRAATHVTPPMGVSESEALARVKLVA